MWRRSVISARNWRVNGHRSARTMLGVRSFSSGADETTLAEGAALRQQLEFCCLVCGWDTPCSTCPFDWRGFDPKERYRVLRRSPKSLNELQGAMKLLELIPADSEPIKTHRLSTNKVKAAFRRKALEWHPDCNKEPGAEEKFREILDAYELLLAVLSSPT